jgi:hypothetical protein
VRRLLLHRRSTFKGTPMDIKLQHVDADRVLQVKGPRVEVVLADAGQANVAMTLSVEDGTHFHYPLPGMPDAAQATLLRPGSYTCVLQITAIDLNFGRSYKCKVTVGNTVVATAKGTIPAGENVDQDFTLFVLEVS